MTDGWNVMNWLVMNDRWNVMNWLTGWFCWFFVDAYCFCPRNQVGSIVCFVHVVEIRNKESWHLLPFFSQCGDVGERHTTWLCAANMFQFLLPCYHWNVSSGLPLQAGQSAPSLVMVLCSKQDKSSTSYFPFWVKFQLVSQGSSRHCYAPRGSMSLVCATFHWVQNKWFWSNRYWTAQQVLILKQCLSVSHNWHVLLLTVL